LAAHCFSDRLLDRILKWGRGLDLTRLQFALRLEGERGVVNLIGEHVERIVNHRNGLLAADNIAGRGFPDRDAG
jgi:hypothetical protein